MRIFYKTFLTKNIFTLTSPKGNLLKGKKEKRGKQKLKRNIKRKGELKMKMTRTASGTKKITISKNEWQDIGKKAGWIKTAISDDYTILLDDYEFQDENGEDQYVDLKVEVSASVNCSRIGDLDIAFRAHDHEYADVDDWDILNITPLDRKLSKYEMEMIEKKLMNDSNFYDKVCDIALEPSDDDSQIVP